MVPSFGAVEMVEPPIFFATINLLGGSSHLVSGLVHPSDLHGIFVGFIHIKKLGWTTHFNSPWVVRQHKPVPEVMQVQTWLSEPEDQLLGQWKIEVLDGF